MSCCASTYAQTRAVEITPYVGYQAGGDASSFDGELSILADVSYGVLVDVRVRPDATIQFLYNRQETNVDIFVFDPIRPQSFDIAAAIHYYHFGGTVELPAERLRPYFVLTIGATRFDPEPEGVQDEWRFSVGIGGGLKTYLSDRFGLRIDGRVWPTFVNTSGGFFCSAPGGCLVSIESDFIVQASASAGVFVGF